MKRQKRIQKAFESMNSDLLIFLSKSLMSRFLESFTEMKGVALGAFPTDRKRTTRLFLIGNETGSASENKMEVHLKEKAGLYRLFHLLGSYSFSL